MLRTLLAFAGLLLLALPAGTFAPGADVPLVAGDYVPDQVIVRFDELPVDLGAFAAEHGARPIMTIEALDVATFQLPSAEAADRMLARAALSADVKYAERDAVVGLAFVPNDPRYAEQWGYPAIFAEPAWDITLGSTAVKVAVVDTGVRVTHPDLAANMCGPHVSTVPGSPNPDDDYGHGTHVAGTVAAVSDNGVGVAGTAQACVMSARVLERGGGGSGLWSWVAAGVVWGTDNGAHVVSMSLQGPFTQVMQDAVRYAWDRDVLVVSAAGNWGCNPSVSSIVRDGSVAYPGRFDESMAVAALVDPGLETAGFSSCGADMEIAGPGQSVLSTTPTGYAFYSGTSMATPHVSGVAALVLTQNPGISNLRLRCLLDLSADDLLPLPGRDFMTGWGRLNAHRALVMDQQLTANGLYDEFETACAAGMKAIMH